MKSDAAPAVGYWKVVAPPRTFQPNDLFRLFSREVRRWLRRLGDRRGNRSLVSTSVTFPDPIDPGSIFGMAHLFSEKLVRDLGDSIWMALGFGDQHYRPHWHGFAVTDQPEDSIKSTWSDLTAGRAKITVITGSAEPWTLEVADPLRMNLNQVIRYALKPQVATIDIPAHSRVVAHGFLRSAWMKSTGLGIADPGTLLVPVSVDHNSGRSIFHQSDSDRPSNRATHDPIQPGRGEVLRRPCRNHQTCGGFVPESTPTGRRTRVDRDLCDKCADRRDGKYEKYDDGHRRPQPQGASVDDLDPGRES